MEGKSRQNSNYRLESNTRLDRKSQERPKSEIFKKVESIENNLENFEKSQNEMKEMLKKKVVVLQFVE